MEADESRAVKKVKLQAWMSRFLTFYFVSFLVVAFMVKGIPMAGGVLLCYLVFGFFYFLRRYEKKRIALGLTLLDKSKR